jgi:hypothetical protein
MTIGGHLCPTKGIYKNVRCLFAKRDCVYFLCRRHPSVWASMYV